MTFSYFCYLEPAKTDQVLIYCMKNSFFFILHISRTAVGRWCTAVGNCERV